MVICFERGSTFLKIVTPSSKNNLFLSLRNLKKIKAITEIQLNPYDLVNADKILILEELIPTIEKKLIL